MACYWLAVSSLILILYDWQILHRVPEGLERLEFVVLVPGLLFLMASFVIGYRRKRREADALKKVFPNGLPVTPRSYRFDDAMAEEGQSGVNASTPSPRRGTPRTPLAMEQARDLLVSSVLSNAGVLQKAVLLLAKEDTSAADGLTRILQAGEEVGKLSPD